MNEIPPKADLPARHRLLLMVGSVGPLGRMPASGTVAVTVAGVPLFYAMNAWTAPVYVGSVVAFSLASVWLHARGDSLLGEKDSRLLVWDELAGFFVAVAFLPAFTWQLAVAAVAIERLLDITKFPPANWVERHCPGGWGVVGDDLVAGAYTCVLLHLGVSYLPGLLGLA